MSEFDLVHPITVNLQHPALILDSREPKLIKLFEKEGIPHLVQSLSVGDIQYGGVVIERKEIFDFASSIMDERMWSQIRRMVVHCSFPFLYIVGTEEKLKKEAQKIKLKINMNSLYGALSSITIRYGVSTWWLQKDSQIVDIVPRIVLKYNEGKLGRPHRIQSLIKGYDTRIDILRMMLGVAENQAVVLLRKYKTVGNIFQVIRDGRANEFQFLHGIGPSTIRKVDLYLNSVFDR